MSEGRASGWAINGTTTEMPQYSGHSISVGLWMELADTSALEADALKSVQVRVLSGPPILEQTMCQHRNVDGSIPSAA
jgi:hypothetical protein